MLSPVLPHPGAPHLDAARETEALVAGLRQRIIGDLRRGGAVLGVSGGVDSAVALALAVRAFPPSRVVALLLPENDSDPASETLAREVCRQYGVEPIREEITAALEGFGCYQRRDEAIRRVVPEFDAASGYRVSIQLPANLLQANTLNTFLLCVLRPDGSRVTAPLAPDDYLQIVAASNFKQRARMSLLYYYGELRHFAVVGTPNKDEHELGFFVRWGDGGYDVAPLVHLFKTQVYELAEYLEVPEEIRHRPPTTDTYSAPCTQQEFFFRLPFSLLDAVWSAWEAGESREATAEATGLSGEQVQWIYADLSRRIRTSSMLRARPEPLKPKPALA